MPPRLPATRWPMATGMKGHGRSRAYGQASTSSPMATATKAACSTTATTARASWYLPRRPLRGRIPARRETRQGVYVFANKDRFEGGFANDLYEGKGVLVYANGDRYEGNYVRGVKQGRAFSASPTANASKAPMPTIYFTAEAATGTPAATSSRVTTSAASNRARASTATPTGDRYEAVLPPCLQCKGKLFLANRDRYEGDFATTPRTEQASTTLQRRPLRRRVSRWRPGRRRNPFLCQWRQVHRQLSKPACPWQGVYHFANGQQKELEFVNGVEKTN